MHEVARERELAPAAEREAVDRRDDRDGQRLERDAERVVGRGGRALAVPAVGPGLHELHVVVAEAPEEPLGAVQGPRVVVLVERPGGDVDDVGQGGEHGAVERLGDGRGPHHGDLAAGAEDEDAEAEAAAGEEDGLVLGDLGRRAGRAHYENFLALF